MSKLKLKESIQKLVDNKQNVTIRINGKSNKVSVFKYDTPQEEYMSFRKRGFRIFVCVECGKEFCKHLRAEFNGEKIEEIESVGKTEEDIFKAVNETTSYEDYKLPQLRKMFPDIKAVSKADFINKIKEVEYVKES